MIAPDDGLRQRLDRLILQAAAQRSEIAQLGSQLEKNLHWADFGFAAGRALRSHPLLAFTAATLLVRLPGSNRLRWLRRIVTAWELFGVMRKERTLR